MSTATLDYTSQKHYIEKVISKRSIGLKIKAGRADQPQEYSKYVEDWPARPYIDIECEGAF